MLTQKKLLQSQLEQVKTKLEEKTDELRSKEITDREFAKAKQEIKELTEKYDDLLKQLGTIEDLVASKVDNAVTLLKSTDAKPPPGGFSTLGPRS